MAGINAQRGMVTVGQEPDDSGVAPDGTGGMSRVGDDPNVAVYRIPGSGGSGYDVTTTDDAPERLTPDHRLYGDSYDQELDDEEAAAVLQGAEDYDGNNSEMINGMNEQEWVDLGRRCFHAARTYYETGWRDTHIENTYLFRSEHSPKSKYADPVYRLRSKTFRPLTRTAARSWEADCAAALFMNDDYMSVTAEVNGDTDAATSAGIIQEIMNLRLLDANWYKVCIGAAQDAFINGPVMAKVYWKQDIASYPKLAAITDAMGVHMGFETQWVQKRTVNKPVIDLILPEMLLIDPKASWVDPIESADYIVHQKQMSVDAVRRKMEMGEWNAYTDNQILSCRWAMDDDATRNAKRGEGAPDPNDNDGASEDFENVRVLEIIVRKNGCDYVYDMMGESFLLSFPVPLESRYHHGKRPFVIGTAMIESHNVMPDSKAKLGASLQEAVNTTANNRMDNVMLAMNKRNIVRRGANIDIPGLSRSTPGGVILTGNPEADIKTLDVGDVTGSSYQETEQLTMEMNEIQGTFSAQAVANNREMNETVGGMEMLSSAATKVVDYDIRTFVNTFVEPALKLFMLNIQYYEDDALIVTKALGAAGFFPRLKYEDLDDDMFTKQLMLKVDVGLGATNPLQRVNTLMAAVNTAAKLPGMEENMDGPAIARRVFANCGLGTGEQFFPNLAANWQPPQQEAPPEDPIVLAAREQAQGVRDAEQMRQEAENQRFAQELETKIQMEKMRLEANERLETLKLAMQAENKDKDIQSSTWWKLLDNETKLRIAQAQDKTKRDTVAVQQGSALKQEAVNAVAQIASTPTSPERQLNE